MRTRHPKIVEFLSRTPPFSLLPPAVLSDIGICFSETQLEKGKILAVRRRTVIDRIYVVKKGSLELFSERNGKKQLHDRIEKGGIFGGISILMHGGISLQTAAAETDAVVYTIPKRRFLELAVQHPAISAHFTDLFRQGTMDQDFRTFWDSQRTGQFLSGTVPFSFLPETALDALAENAPLVFHSAEKVLFLQDRSTLDAVHVIYRGAMEQYYRKNEEKIVSGILGEGDTFGAISILLNKAISIRTVKTIEETACFALPKDLFLDICRRHETFSAYFTDAFGKRMLDRSYAEIFRRQFQPKGQDLYFFNLKIGDVATHERVACNSGRSIQEAAEAMSRRDCSAIFVQSDDNDIVGLVTDNDLRRKVIAGGFDTERPVSEIMSAPLQSITADAMVIEGLMVMMRENVKHLAVKDPRGQVVGMVTSSDLLRAQGQSPIFLVREIHTADRIEAITDKFDQVPKLVRQLLHSGAKADHLTRLISTISDAILNRIIHFSLQEAGPAPVPFVFMIMGSEGRREQTLKTDQDNAIVYEDVHDGSDTDVNAYFLALGEKICNRLNDAGYALCKGEVMAKNPKWCASISRWKKYFSDWIHAAAPEDLLYSSIFFDFRGAYGDFSLIDRLRGHLFSSLVGWEGFFRHLTENALRFKPPLGFFRNFVVASKGEHRNTFDIKYAMMPIVDFARVYALKNQLEETNTLERLHQLRLKNVLDPDAFHELEQSYGFLMQMRFVRQVSAVMELSENPDNHIDPRQLSGIEQKMLKEIFKRVEKFQQKMEFDFMGTVGSSA